MSEPTKVKESAGEQATSFMPSDEWGSFQFTTSADAKRAEHMFNQLSSKRDALESERDQLRERVAELTEALTGLLAAWDAVTDGSLYPADAYKARVILAKERP